MSPLNLHTKTNIDLMQSTALQKQFLQAPSGLLLDLRHSFWPEEHAWTFAFGVLECAALLKMFQIFNKVGGANAQNVLHGE